MNNVEFSNLFDVLYNNITSNQAPGLNEYEKSVFLTKAQDEVLKNYFNPKSNPKQEGFDDTIKRLADFSCLMREDEGTIVTNPASQFDPRSLVYKIPEDVYLIINEQILLKQSTTVKGIRQILPINYEEYRRVMSKPYKEPLKYQAWRLFTSTESNSFNGLRIAEIILTSPDKNLLYDKEYKVRYIKFPKPIILSNFSDAFGEDISINGYNGSEMEYAKNPKYVALYGYLDPHNLENDVAGYITTPLWSNGYNTYKTNDAEYQAALLEVTTDEEMITLDRAERTKYNNYLVATHPNLYSNDEYVSIWDPCELDPVLHEEILQRAVELAKIAWLGDVNTAIQTGLRSE